MGKILLFIFSTMLAIESSNGFAKIYDFTFNNSVELLNDSKASSELKIEMIKNAKHHIHIMSYYLDNSEFPTKVLEELRLAHDRGVEVRVLSTFIPTLAKDFRLKTQKSFTLKDDGAAFSYLLLMPLNNVMMLNNLHEKIFLIDGEMAIIGGRNLSDNSFRSKDIEALVHGGIVHQLQDHFYEMFNFVLNLNEKHVCRFKFKRKRCVLDLEKQKFLKDDSDYYPEVVSTGNIKARLITHDAVIEQSKHRFDFTQRAAMQDDIIDSVVSTNFSEMRAYNYFVLPTIKYQDFIFKNLSEGHQIKIISNSLKTAAAISDMGYLFSLPTINEFLQKGVQLYQWQGPENEEYLHEKVIVFDRDHVFLGSHNYGMGSTTVSNEIAMEFYSSEIGNQLVQIFENEIGNQNKTLMASNLSVNNEINTNLKTIKFLRGSFLGEILEESY